MAASAAGKFVSTLCTLKVTSGRLKLGYAPACTLLQTRNYAARKGTREKARKKKVKVEVRKTVFVPHNQRGVKQTVLPIDKVRVDDSQKQDLPTDNVWIGKYYKWKVYSFEEAVECHKETHRLGMLDAPDAFIKAVIELDMIGPKPSKPVTKFARLVSAPHPFNHGESRSIAVFCKTPEIQEQAKKAGATIVGGPELIPRVQTGDVALADYDNIVAHPNMMAELVVIKGLLKKKFPSPGAGSLTADIPGAINKLLYGIKYSGNPHQRQSLYGIAEAQFGRLSMDTKKLEENFAAVINDINAHRPRRPGPFITRVCLSSYPSKETLKVNHELYLKEETVIDNDDDDDDGEEDVAAAV